MPKVHLYYTFLGGLCQTLVLVGDDCKIGLVNNWVCLLDELPKMHPTFLILVAKQHGKS